jgi:hypothetical protein
MKEMRRLGGSVVSQASCPPPPQLTSRTGARRTADSTVRNRPKEKKEIEEDGQTDINRTQTKPNSVTEFSIVTHGSIFDDPLSGGTQFTFSAVNVYDCTAPDQMETFIFVYRPQNIGARVLLVSWHVNVL